jgi:hypothetical protein
MEIFAVAVQRCPDTTSAVSAVSQTPLMPGNTDTTYSASELSDISKNSGNVSDNADWVLAVALSETADATSVVSETPLIF